jgi:hypothetical protein
MIKDGAKSLSSIRDLAHTPIDYITRKWAISIQSLNQAMAYFLIRFEGGI